jgi:hypothetical protein
VHPEGPATGHVDTGFQANAEMVSKFQVATACFSCSPQTHQNYSVVNAADLIVFQIIDKTIRNSKFRCLSEATPYHHNVFTFALFLPEGRAGLAWEPSNKMKLFLPPRKIKCLSLHSLIYSLNLLFIYPSHLSLSLSLSRLRLQRVKHRR